MGHAGDIALGLALARPERKVVCVNGDGSLAMNLGSLITAADAKAANLVMLVMENGAYEIVGGGRVPGAGLVDYSAAARACGWPTVRRFEHAAAFAQGLPELLAAPGPALATLAVADPPSMPITLPARHPRDASRTAALSGERSNAIAAANLVWDYEDNSAIMVLGTFFAYLGVLILIGFVAQRKTKDLDDFVLADRKLGLWATAFSYEVTAYSGWLMLGFPGKAFLRGFAALWVGLSCVAGDALNWIFVSRRLREETEKLRALTVPEYLDRRFHRDGSHAVRIAASLAIMVFMLIYMWSQVVAAGKAVATVTGLSYFHATALSTAVILLYTFQGGYLAVVWVDVFQGIMMMMALVVLPITCLVRLGGWDGLMAVLQRASAEAAASGSPDLASNSGHLGELFAGIGGLLLFRFLFEDAGVGIGYLGQPHICTRFMSIEHPRQLRPAFVISVLFALLVCTGAVSVGLVRARLVPLYARHHTSGQCVRRPRAAAIPGRCRRSAAATGDRRISRLAGGAGGLDDHGRRHQFGRRLPDVRGQLGGGGCVLSAAAARRKGKGVAHRRPRHHGGAGPGGRSAGRVDRPDR